MPFKTERGENLSGELQQSAADVLGRSVNIASGSTVATGAATWLEVIPPIVGAFVALAGLAVTIFLAWKKNKIYNLQVEELERHRRKDES
jgi:hypothetical protein